MELGDCQPGISFRLVQRLPNGAVNARDDGIERRYELILCGPGLSRCRISGS
jgi:hypothetical protein